MFNQEIPTLDISWLVAEWLKNKKKFKGKRIVNVDTSQLNLEDTDIDSTDYNPTIQSTELHREVTVKYQPSHTERDCKLTLKLKRQKKTTITVLEGIVKGFDINLPFHIYDPTIYQHSCSSDFSEINTELETLTKPVPLTVQEPATAKIIVVQQRRQKNIVKRLKLSGDVKITFQDGGKPYVKDIAKIVAKLKKQFEAYGSDCLDMLSVSRSGKVKWDMKVEAEQIWDAEITVNFS